MRGEWIDVKHPRDSFARLGSLADYYFDIAELEYCQCIETELQGSETESEGESSQISKRATQHALKTVVFAALCVEAAINNYGGAHLGDVYYETHLKSLDVVSKWVVIPQLACGHAINKSGAAFGALKQLIKSRNELVHNSSRELDLGDPALSEELAQRDAKFRSGVLNSIRALYLLRMEMDYVVGQQFNPLGTLDPAFNLMYQPPAATKRIFDECRNIVLRNCA